MHSHVRPHSVRLAILPLEDRLNPGGGSFDSTTGTFSFSVAVQYVATDDELKAIRTAFQIGSDVIADATDGQHRFGNVTIVNNSGASAEAEFYIDKVNSQTDGTPVAPMGGGGYGVRGLHVNLYQYVSDSQYGNQLYGGNTLDANNANGAGYTVAHEFAHLAYGIMDEYSGPPVIGGRPSRAENAPASAESATLNYSLMDNYFTRGGAGAPFTLNEFSVAKNHDPDNDTFQTTQNGRNDWAQIATRYPVTIPSGLPVDAPPASQPVNFRFSTTNAPMTVLALENSGTVLQSDLRGFIQTGGVLYVQTTKANESVGVIHYASGVNITSSIRTMTPENQQAVINAINALPASTDPVVEPGEALRVAINFIESRADSPNRVIVLVGSGVGAGTLNLLDFVPRLNQQNISVITVLANTNPTINDMNTFRALATQTGGAFITMNNTDDFPEIVSLFGTFRNGDGILAAAPPSDLPANGTVSQFVTVEPGTTEVILGSAALTPGAEYTVTLQSPSGQVISAPGAGVEALPPGPIVGYRVLNPEAGVWTVLSTAGPSNVGPVGVVGMRQDDPFRIVVATDANQVAFPTPATVNVTPTYFGKSVVGASVTGVAISPNGTQTPMIFFDDGLSVHGDLIAGDGTYSARFNNYANAESGVYSFQVVVNASTATTLAGEGLPNGGAEPVGEPVPPFTRIGSGNVLVTGVPASVVSNDLAVLLTQLSPTTIQLAVTNNGGSDATNVSATLFLGSALTALSGIASQGSFTTDDSDLTFSVGTLAPGAVATLTINILASRSRAYNLFAEVASADQTDPILENNEFALPVVINRLEMIAVGGDRGNGGVFTIQPPSNNQTTITPFGPTFTSGVRVASGDFTGDAIPDLVVGAGPGSSPLVILFDGSTGAEVRRLFAFEESFTGGVYVVLGDLNGDGYADLVVTPDEGGGPRVRILDGKTGNQIADFFGIDDPNFRGGARAAIGDINGDGHPDLIVAAGFGGGPRLAVFDGSKLGPDGGPKLFGDFLAFEDTLRNGVFVTSGDVDGDGYAELIAGGGPGGGPRVSVFDGFDLLDGTQTRDADFFAGNPENRGGVRVTVKNFDGDEHDDILTGPGAGGGSTVLGYPGATLIGSEPPSSLTFDPFGNASGVFVG